MKLVLIGGGSVGRANTKYETKEIDEEIVKLTDKKEPNFLFIGLADDFADSYYKVIKDIYKNLGCITGKITNKTLTHMEVVQEKISKADIIYIGGGNTKKLVNVLKETKMDKMLRCALEKGSVLSGISAGAIACCKCGLSDVEIISKISNNYVVVDGLGFLDFMFVPHFSSDPKKKEDLNKVLGNYSKIRVMCLDDCTALKIVDKKIEIIKSDPSKNVFYVNDGKFLKIEKEMEI